LLAADAIERRAARAVTLVATLWFALAASWEAFGPILSGHYASSASVGIIAENMLRWRILGPVWDYTASAPVPAMYYSRHPFGIFWTTALLMKIFGRHDVVCRLAPILLSVGTPPLLHAVGRAIWRPAAGAAAAAAFVVLPITLSFASFNALEVPVITWSLLGLWGWVRLTQTGSRRHLAAALVGCLLALNADWPAHVLVGGMLGFALLRTHLAPGLFGRARHLSLRLAWWIWSIVIAGGTLALYLALFKRSGKLAALVAAYEWRSAGNDQPLWSVLAARRYWLELCFTPVALGLGVVAAAVAVVRLVALRREHEWIPIAVWLMAAVQYFVFKQGADVHVFWPHYFALYFALGMGAIVATAAPLLARVPALARSGPLAALGLSLLPLIVIARDGVAVLSYARDTGGCFDERGRLVDIEGDKVAFLAHLRPTLPNAVRVSLHESMRSSWSYAWALGGRVVGVGERLPAAGAQVASVLLADARRMSVDDLASVVASRRVGAVGPFLWIDLASTSGSIDAYSFTEREPEPWEWWLVSATEPRRTVAPDPWLAWEIAVHCGRSRPAPTAPPRTLDQKRVAHNAAVEAGDRAHAAALRAEIEAALTPFGEPFDDGTTLLGTTFAEGVRPLLTLWFEAGGPTEPGVKLEVESEVIARARWSTTMADPQKRDVAQPLAIPPERWIPGFLYAAPTPIRRRPGTEVFSMRFSLEGPDEAPQPLRGGSIHVLELR
jgi:4-amino-4-deoxy-L-arabinose transferase-like glycosyltransferase